MFNKDQENRHLFLAVRSVKIHGDSLRDIAWHRNYAIERIV